MIRWRVFRVDGDDRSERIGDSVERVRAAFVCDDGLAFASLLSVFDLTRDTRWRGVFPPFVEPSSLFIIFLCLSVKSIHHRSMDLQSTCADCASAADTSTALETQQTCAT